jgi:hypothetical protein
MSIAESAPTLETPVVRGLPVLGSALEMAKDPARFFVRCYREHGPVFRVKILNKTYTVIAGVDAANFLGTREGRESLRSKEFWQGLVDEYGATRTLTGEDGESHKELREVMRRGYSREAIKGRSNELVDITDRSIERDWRPGGRVPVVRAMQYHHPVHPERAGDTAAAEGPAAQPEVQARQGPRVRARREDGRRPPREVRHEAGRREEPGRRHHGRAHRRPARDAGQ